MAFLFNEGQIQKKVVFQGGCARGIFCHNVPDGYGPQSGGNLPNVLSALASGQPNLLQVVRTLHARRQLADFWTAGEEPIRTAMMAMTTKSSSR